ncbi:tRNA (adenosine(37)-N6)-threonylcarbamoyltransferase complex dimerization subunit type 1 TsaB [Streptococcus porcinus]|uniref:tRNA (Adenosine(37)-N6)-threonylcarbamoyltransferase complex dimerization subunit type 1 TsaB n=1 Tax=Streptococcus porcinus TaxID=1340 RepID=A0A7W0ARJ3_STRPO|nr:tRNA (adenosine(37)-N6)-threonylcarbamoyltransferase complex dimerization subunit type 1 TsaB [Streptococcus porcinus]MBA2796336.1 tRNA (adenosine(37)-N6)-threonylcarbamoyltransferase complex dimerization subunit type 1 TsaB [Streptococcus porcinus]
MKILAFDTSNKSLSLAILEDRTLLADLTINIKKNHSINLMPAIDFLMDSLDLCPKDIGRIAVAQGPGSYTGLRVAVATAKMLAYSLKIDLVGISSLYALAATFTDPETLVVPLIDARRQNVYAGFYQNKESVRADQHIALSDLIEELKGQTKIIFTGEVAGFSNVIKEQLPKAEIHPTLPSAFELGLKAQNMSPVNVDAFVPEYLKKVEAEEIWLKIHQPESETNYIKRV